MYGVESCDAQVSVLGACLGEPSQACLIMELVEGGSLAARIHDRKKRRLTYMQILQVYLSGDALDAVMLCQPFFTALSMCIVDICGKTRVI